MSNSAIPLTFDNLVMATHARATGATIVAGRVRGAKWGTICLNHTTSAQQATRVEAELATSHPQDWCAGCKRIYAGKDPRLGRDRRVQLP